MAYTTAISGSSRVQLEREAFDQIEAQFQLDDEGTHTITKQFLEDFRRGLEEYGHSMAMMYAALLSTRFCRS